MLHLKWQLLVSRHKGSSGKLGTVPQRWIWCNLWILTADGELNRHLSHILFYSFICLLVYLLHRVDCLQDASRTLRRLLPFGSLTPTSSYTQTISLSTSIPQLSSCLSVTCVTNQEVLTAECSEHFPMHPSPPDPSPREQLPKSSSAVSI